MKVSKSLTVVVLAWCLLVTGYAQETGRSWDLDADLSSAAVSPPSEEIQGYLERIHGGLVLAQDHSSSLPLDLFSDSEKAAFLRALPQVQQSCEVLHQASLDALEVQYRREIFQSEILPLVQALADRVQVLFQDMALEEEEPVWLPENLSHQQLIEWWVSQPLAMIRRSKAKSLELFLVAWGEFQQRLSAAPLSRDFLNLSNLERCVERGVEYDSCFGGRSEYLSSDRTHAWVAPQLRVAFEMMGERWVVTSTRVERTPLEVPVAIWVAWDLVEDTGIARLLSLCSEVAEDGPIVERTPGERDAVWDAYQRVGEGILSMHSTVNYGRALLEQMRREIRERGEQ